MTDSNTTSLGLARLASGVTEKTRHAGPDKIDQVRGQDPVLDRVAVEEVDLQRRPAKAHHDQPQDHGGVVVLDGVENLVPYGTALDQAGGPYENEGEHRVDHEHVHTHLTQF